MATSEQKKKLLKAKIAVALHGGRILFRSSSAQGRQAVFQRHYRGGGGGHDFVE